MGGGCTYFSRDFLNCLEAVENLREGCGRARFEESAA